MGKRVVVTGLGVVSPVGAGVASFLVSLIEGKSGIRFFPELEQIRLGCCIGGKPDLDSHPYFQYIEKYNLTEHISSIQYAVLAALEAWIDAGLNIPGTDSEMVNTDTGCAIGSIAGNIEIIAHKIVPLVNSGNSKRMGSKVMDQIQFHSPAAFLSNVFALGNQTQSNSCACASSLASIYNGYEWIKNGKASKMIVGGTEGYSPYLWAVVDSARMTARGYNDHPEKASRPMSNNVSGFVPGAGSGMLILEEYESAVRRNANIYCELSGGAVNSGGQRNGGTMTAPSPLGIERCIRDALTDAKITCSDVDYISGHLTSTMADVIEIICWSKTLGRKNEDFPYVNSLKAMTGHCMGAAGALETIAAILQMKHRFVFPALNSEDLHPLIEKNVSRNRIPLKTIRDIELNTIMKANFGTGDVNACVVLKKI